MIDAKFITHSSTFKALGIIGDRWTLMVLRDAFQGAHRFEEFRSLSGAARSTLTSRLTGLVDAGVLHRIPYSDSPTRYEYRLTEMGMDLYWTTLVTWRWEHAWAPRDAGIPTYLRHRTCGHAMQPILTCSHCKTLVAVNDTTSEVIATKAKGAVAKPRFRRISSITSETHRGKNEAFVHITDILGDRWTPLVLSAAFLGVRRFDDLLNCLDIATNILAHRLGHLVANQILERREYSSRPPRSEYRLTQKGHDLFPHAILLMQWGDRWLMGQNEPNLRVFHKDCGGRLGAIVACDHCHEAIQPNDVTFPPSSARKK